MRKILFRGKAINRDERYETRTKYKNGDWVYGLVSKLGSEKYGIPMEMTNTDGISGIDVDRKTVGQYTGLKDLHGTRIFEGDVVKSIAAWYVVEFENGGYGLRPFGKGKLIPIMGHGNFNENEVEVIGNIHDNPELMEGK